MSSSRAIPRALRSARSLALLCAACLVWSAEPVRAQGACDGGAPACEEQRLAAPDAEQGDALGEAIARDGEWLVVGADEGSIDLGASTIGSAYVFRGVGDVFGFHAKLTPSDGEAGDGFAVTVGVSAERIAVGAPLSELDIPDAGAVYVYRLEGDDWVEEARLVAEDAAARDQLGASVAIDGDVLAAGAVGSGSGGAVYVFRRVEGVWQQEARLAGGVAPNANLGSAVAIEGDMVVGGAPFDLDPDDLEPPRAISGSARVFRRVLGIWEEAEVLAAPERKSLDLFGSAVSVSSERVAVGAHTEDGSGQSSGAAYVFAPDVMGLAFEQRITAGPDAAALDFFASGVSLFGNTLAVGAPGAEQGSAPGRVHRFERVDSLQGGGPAWVPAEVHTASDGVGGDRLGAGVANAGAFVAAGAPGAALGAGAAYLFGPCPADADLDCDGVVNAADNCPVAANGPARGTCTVGALRGTPCEDDIDCGEDGFCSLDQEDADADAIGDACECGDASGDGEVDTSDARSAQRCAVGQEVCAPLCDATGDDECNTLDARIIQRLAVGQVTKQELSCSARP